MKAAIYARVSTIDKQDYERQVYELKELALMHGYKEKDIEVFAESISGYKKKDDRPKLMEMLNKAETNPKYFKCIYTTEISRIGREPNETRRIIDNLTELKVPVYIKTIGQSTLDENGKRNMIMSIILQVLIEYANLEAETFKERSKSGLLRNARNGKAGGSDNHPYGYKKDGLKGMLVIEETEALIIQRVFDYYCKGYGDKMISNILNMENVPTRMNLTHSGKMVKLGKTPKDGSKIQWSDTQIGGIIQNPIYKGKRLFKGNTFDAPAIIDEKLWNQCNHIRKNKTHRNYETEYTYLLKDKMKCGICGRNMFAKYKPVPGGDKVYICSSRLTKGGGCGNTGINIEFIESVVFQEITYAPLPACVGNKAENKKNLKDELERLNLQLDIESKNINDKTNELERAIDLCISDIITKAALKEKQKKIENSIQQSQRKINNIKGDIKQKKETLKNYDSNEYGINQMKKIKSSREEMARVMKQIVHKVIVTKVSNSEFLVAMYFALIGENPLSKLHFAKPVHLLLDKTALMSRYGGDLKYINNYPTLKNSPVYDCDVLITDAGQHLREMKRNPQYIIPELIKIAP